MTSHLLNMPVEDAARLASWLEDRLICGELGELVAELRALAGEPVEPLRLELPVEPEIRLLLGAQADDVLTAGLAALSADRLAALVAQPARLLVLQAWILEHGGIYWKQAVERGAKSRQSVTLSHVAASRPDYVARRAWLMAVAAMIVMALALAWPRQHSAVAWGWGKPAALRQDVARDEYLKGVALAAGDWFDTRPTEELALAQRIGEFRQNCSRLLLSDHRPLPPADRAWLNERCQKWATQLDQQLAALEAGGDPADTLAAIDGLVRKLQTALEKRAGESHDG